jgi:hypothetical protein
MFAILREEKPDYIVHCGDIAHTKNQISPEFVEMCSWFLKELADITTTFVILGNHDCLASDHDILTKNSGWVNIAKYIETNREEEVATFSVENNKVQWQKPYGTIKRPFNGEMINIKGNKIDQLVTPTHQSLYKPYSTSAYKKKNADEIKAGDLIPIKGKAEAFEQDYYYQLLGFSFADGTFVLRDDTKSAVDEYHNSRVQFHFRKERKIKYLSSILEKLNYSYNICRQKDGTSFIRIYSKLGREICSFFSGKKEIPTSLLSMTENQIKNFIYGYLQGDGSKIEKSTYSCNTISKKSADIMCAAARMVGYSSYISERQIFGNYKNSTQQYNFFISMNNKNLSKVTEVNKISYSDFVYCVAVDNENFLTRRNGKISITGNCNLKNDTRQDSISPIVTALNHPNLKLWKYSGERVIDEKLAFNVLSLIDEDKWVKPSDPNKINIALYHGAITGVSTDVGYTMEHSDHDVAIFEGHDYAMIGDIHKTNQGVDQEQEIELEVEEEELQKYLERGWKVVEEE